MNVEHDGREVLVAVHQNQSLEQTRDMSRMAFQASRQRDSSTRDGNDRAKRRTWHNPMSTEYCIARMQSQAGEITPEQFEQALRKELKLQSQPHTQEEINDRLARRTASARKHHHQSNVTEGQELAIELQQSRDSWKEARTRQRETLEEQKSKTVERTTLAQPQPQVRSPSPSSS